MKKLIVLWVLLLMIASNGYSQNVVQSNFQSVLVPQYICSGTSTRLPYIFRATVNGLSPNATYRYYTQVCRYTDIGAANSGAGNPILINGTNFRYTSSTSLSNPAGYDSLTTDNTGSYTGWFGFVHTGNARFTAGNYVMPTLTLDSMQNGAVKYRYALNDSIFVLKYSDSTITTAGTGIYGLTTLTPKNVLSLYDNTTNTGRPLAVAFLENSGIDTTTLTSLAVYYKDSVVTRNGRWGTVIPNILASGVKRINQHSLANGQIISYNTSLNGVWPSGASTVNPTGGSALPIRMTGLDVLLSANENGTVTPDKFELMQNYPNPFNPTTTIRFSLPVSGIADMRVYDMLGREVKILISQEFTSGSYSVEFSADNLSSGIYFYKLNFTGSNGTNFFDTKKLILIK